MNNNIKYKLNSINKAQITAAARKALMAADSYYHAWPSLQQENFRATMDENARNRVGRVLLNSLLDIQCSVDEVVGQQQVVIKSLETNFKQVNGLAGATVLGDGSVALILDVLGLSQYHVDHEVVQAANKNTGKMH